MGYSAGEEWAVKDLDGMSIKSLLCVGFNRSNGVIGTQRPFDEGHWNDHCSTKTHQDRLANQAAMKRRKNPAQNRKQQSMTNFFSAKPKKQDTATVAVEASPAEETAAIAEETGINTSTSSNMGSEERGWRRRRYRN